MPPAFRRRAYAASGASARDHPRLDRRTCAAGARQHSALGSLGQHTTSKPHRSGARGQRAVRLVCCSMHFDSSGKPPSAHRSIPRGRGAGPVSSGAGSARKSPEPLFGMTGSTGSTRHRHPGRGQLALEIASGVRGAGSTRRGGAGTPQGCRERIGFSGADADRGAARGHR